MAFFLTQWTYKDTEIKEMVLRPQSREDNVRLAVEELGGRLHAFYFCLGEYDGMCITEFEDKETALACLMVVIGQGAARTIRTTPLFGEHEIKTAMNRANALLTRPQDDRPHYEPPSRTPVS